MVDNQIRQKLPQDQVILDNQQYDKSIIGISLDGRIIYSFDKMVDELMEEYTDWEYDDQVDWIEYNTIRQLPYAGQAAPMVVYEQG